MSPLVAFAGAPEAPNWWRLALAFVAVIHVALCLRVLLVRGVRRLRGVVSPDVERVPASAMLAHGTFCGHAAWVLLTRIESATSEVVWVSLAVYTAALVAGTVAFTRIVVLVRRDRATRRS